MVAVAFACGLGLGVVLGAAIWSGALHLAKIAVNAALRRETAQWRQQSTQRHRDIEKAKEQIRMKYGDQMTQEQERIMEAELGKLYKDFPNPKM